MKELTEKETALLGLLMEEPRHAYSIEQEVKYRDMRYWVGISMSLIYKLLAKLEREGHVKSKTAQVKGKTQKIFSLTPLGEKMCKLKIIHLLSKPEHSRWQVDVGLAFGSFLSKAEQKSCIAQYIKGLEEKITGYTALQEFLEGHKASKTNMGLATRPLALYAAEIKWAKDFAKGL